MYELIYMNQYFIQRIPPLVHICDIYKDMYEFDIYESDV